MHAGRPARQARPARKAPPVPRERPAPRATRARPGAAGPPGPAGPAGPSLPSLESLNGVGCHLAGAPGTATLTYDAGGVATLKCVPTGGGSSAEIRVNEFMTGSTGAASNEFVELFNAGSSAADVGGFKVAYRSSAGTSDITLATIPAGTSIPAGCSTCSPARLPRLTRGRPVVLDLARGDRRRPRRPRHGRRDPRLGRLRRHDQRLRGGPSGHGAARRPRLRAAARANPRRPRHERQCGRLLGQRDALSGGLEPLGTPAGGAPAGRPPITPTGHARPEGLTDTGSAGHTPRIGVFKNCGNCGDWSHSPAHPRTVALTRAHARGRRAGRASARAPTGAARGQRKGNTHVGTRDS